MFSDSRAFVKKSHIGIFFALHIFADIEREPYALGMKARRFGFRRPDPETVFLIFFVPDRTRYQHGKPGVITSAQKKSAVCGHVLPQIPYIPAVKHPEASIP
jgi:hypothetical protein